MTMRINLKPHPTYWAILLLLLIASCKKEDNQPEKSEQQPFSKIGLIENFELHNPSQTIIYINPENKKDPEENGSIEHPFDSFSDISKWKDNTSYAIKRGTKIYAGEIVISGNNITLCSYGAKSEKRPTIESTTEAPTHAVLTHYLGIENLTVRDIEIYAPKAASSLRFLRNNKNVRVINCKLHGGIHGLRSIESHGLWVENTEIFNVKDDGMYIKETTDIEILNCYIHHVNLNWKPPHTSEEKAGGDGIQLAECRHWHVHHNIINRIGSGNKACFISKNPEQNDGILEYNEFYGPTTTGNAIYLHDGTGLIVRYNRFEDVSLSPVYTHSSDLQFYGNIVIRMGFPLFASKTANVYNNLFYETVDLLKGGKIKASNNIYYSSEDIVINVSELSGSNNLYSSDKVPQGSFSGIPLFVDPENGDFRIKEGSISIDKGTDVGLKHDFFGVSIPQGGAPDIGPYEFVK